MILKKFFIFFFILLSFFSSSFAIANTPQLRTPWALASCDAALSKPLIFKHSPSSTDRALSNLPKLKFMTYNVENFFMHVGHYERTWFGTLIRTKPSDIKPEAKIIMLGNVIRNEDPDVLLLQEVENLEAVEKFNQEHLGGKYKVLFFEGNDERGIDVCILVKKDLPLDLEYRTHRGFAWSDPILEGVRKPLFSRDLPVLLIRAAGADPKVTPLLAVLVTHYKSKRPRPNDPNSNIWRGIQVKQTALIIQKLRQEFGANLNLVFGGDFNGELHREKEFLPLWDEAQLLDPLPTTSITHVYFPRKGTYKLSQLDALLVSQNMRPYVLSATVVPYRDEQGQIKPIPHKRWERDENPSDHFPVVMELDIHPLLIQIP